MSNVPPQRDSVLTQLITAYAVFRDARPLAIGIHKATKAAHPEIDGGALRKTLQRYTASTKYLKAIAAGGARFGLDGIPDGDITPKQQQQARDAVNEPFRKQADQRQAALKAQEHQARLLQLVDKFRPR